MRTLRRPHSEVGVTGIWNLTISSPVGQRHAVLDLVEKNGAVGGTGRADEDFFLLREVRLSGNRLTWRLSISRPFRLELAFDVVIDGDRMTGTSRAGWIPPSKVVGTRRRPEAP